MAIKKSNTETRLTILVEFKLTPVAENITLHNKILVLTCLEPELSHLLFSQNIGDHLDIQYVVQLTHILTMSSFCFHLIIVWSIIKSMKSRNRSAYKRRYVKAGSNWCYWWWPSWNPICRQHRLCYLIALDYIWERTRLYRIRFILFAV